MAKRLSLRARLVLAVVALAAVGPARRGRRDVLVAALVPATTARTRTLDADRPYAAPPGPRRRHPIRAARDVRPGALARRGDAPSPHFPARRSPARASRRRRCPPRSTPPTRRAGRASAVRYFTVAGEQGGGGTACAPPSPRTTSAMLVVATSLRDVDSTLERLLLIELVVTRSCSVRSSRSACGSSGSACSPLDAIGETASAIAAGDLSRRVERAEERTEVGRLGLALNAMLSPDRRVVPRAGGVGAEAPTLRRRRLARAPHAAVRSPRVRRALRPGRRRAPRRPRALDAGHQSRVGADEPSRRRSPAPRQARRRPAPRARAGATRRRRRRGGRDGADRRSGTPDRAPLPSPRSSSETATGSGRSSTTSSRTSAPIPRPARRRPSP